MTGLTPVSQSSAGGPTAQLPLQMQTGAQNQAFQGIGGLSSFNNYNPSAAGSLTSALTNNPYAGAFQQGAGTASTMGQQGATALQGGANQVIQTAFDPQHALYNRYLQLMQNQSQAGYAQSGVGSSPYAAGLMDQNLQNFNTTWQAQQLQNQIGGLGAAQSAFGVAPSLFYQSSLYPYQASTGMANQGMAGLSQLQQYGQQAGQIPEQQIQDYMQLLGLQPALSGAQNQTATTQANLQALELSQLGAGVGAGANVLGSLGKLASGGMTLF